MDQLTALRVFRRVVERGSFAAAARDCRLSPAAVSKNVGELEAHLSARLLTRTTRRLSLTEAGARYYDRIAGVLDELEAAEGALGELRQHPQGHLRVTAPLTLSLVKLSAAIPRFLERHPSISLDLRLDDRRVDIVAERIDVAIRASDQLEDSSLVARKLADLPHVVCGSPAYFERAGVPRTPDDLAGHACVRFTLSGHADEWAFGKDGRSVTVPVAGRYAVASSLAVRDALRADFGLSLMPRVYVQRDLEAGRLRTVLDDWSSVGTAVYAVYPSRRYLAAKVRAFLDFLEEAFAESASALSAERNRNA